MAGDDSNGVADDVATFAAELRQMRLEAGNPTLARIQAETGISRTVISEAFAGRQLPSARSVDGIVRMLGGSVPDWHARRDALAGGTPPAESAPPADPAPPASTAGFRRRTVALWAIAGFVVGSVLSGVTSGAIVSETTRAELASATTTTVASDEPADTDVDAQIVVHNGEDPALTACVDDAKVATADSREADTLLEIIWSNKCYAGWARITRYDAKYEGNTVTIAIYPETAPTGEARQEATEHDVQGAYTTLVVRPTPDTLLCAEGSFTVDGETIDLGEPLCI